MGKTRDENVERLYLLDVAADPAEEGEFTNNAGVLKAQDTEGVFNLRQGIEINALPAKASPVSGDFILIEDSEAANAKKRITIGDLPGGADPDAIHDNVAAEINAVTEKASPVGADVLLIEDSADSYNKKRVQITNLPGGADPDAIHDNVAGEITAITAKSAPVSADTLLIEDSEASDAKKSVSLADLFSILSPGPVFDAYDHAGGTSVVAGAAVPLSVERQKTSDFTHSTSTSNSEVTIAVAGQYIVHAEVTTDVTSGSSRSDSSMWLELDTGSGFAEVEGTRGEMYNRQATQGASSASCTAILNLDAGDKLRIYCQRNSGSNTVVLHADGSRLIITAMRGPAGADGADGADGAQGDPGSGSNIVVKDDGSTVGTVMDTINFGSGLVVTDDGSGNCTVDAAGGVEEYTTWDASGGSTTSTSFQTIETLTFTPSNAGEDWLVEWGCEWKVADADERCLLRVLIDGATVINEHYDIGLVNNAYSVISCCFQLSALSASSHTIAVQYHPLHNWTTMTIKNIFIRARSLG